MSDITCFLKKRLYCIYNGFSFRNSCNTVFLFQTIINGLLDLYLSYAQVLKFQKLSPCAQLLSNSVTNNVFLSILILKCLLINAVLPFAQTNPFVQYLALGVIEHVDRRIAYCFVKHRKGVSVSRYDGRGWDLKGVQSAENIGNQLFLIKTL